MRNKHTTGDKHLSDILPTVNPPADLLGRVMDDIPCGKNNIATRNLDGILPTQEPDSAMFARIMDDIPTPAEQATRAEMDAILPMTKPSDALQARIQADMPQLVDAEDEEENAPMSKWLKVGMVALGINVTVTSYAVAENFMFDFAFDGVGLFSSMFLMGIGG